MAGTIALGPKATLIERTGADLLLEALNAGGTDWVLTGSEAKDKAEILIGTSESSPAIAAMKDALKLADLGPEGFVTGQAPNGTTYVVAAQGPRGVLYGCAAVAEQLRLGKRLESIRFREKPVLEDRILWAWNGPTRRDSAFFGLKRMLDIENQPHFQELGRYLATARINGLGLWTAPRTDPGSPDAVPEALEGYRRMTRWLRERYGVETYLFLVYQLDRSVHPPFKGWPICPFDERVRTYWREHTERLIRETPDLRGIIMAGAGGDWVRGPFECTCERCRRHTNRELLVEAMKMIGEPWAKAGGRIIWKAVTDRPTLVKSEVENFANLDDMLPPYVTISHKTFYKDFRPPHPLQPIFYAHEDNPGRSRPYLCEFQIYGEYRGGTHFPCVMIDRWADVAPLLARKHYRGAIAVCSFKDVDEWDHPLNMANWYAFGRYAWNPNTPPDEIYRDWATLTFGPEAADRVIRIARTSYEASTGLMFFRGVMIQNHSKLPTIDYELDSSLVGPWHDIPKAPDGQWGRGHDVSMYPPEVAEQIRKDPALLLWANRVPVTPELCDEAIAQTAHAAELVKQMAREWDGLPHAGWEALHGRVSEQLRRNVVDAEVWHEDIRLYFDYKAGRLTREELGRRIEDIRRRFNPEDGSDLLRTFDDFLKEWTRVYEGNHQRRSMEGAHYNPRGERFLPGLSGEERR